MSYGITRMGYHPTYGEGEAEAINMNPAWELKLGSQGPAVSAVLHAINNQKLVDPSKYPSIPDRAKDGKFDSEVENYILEWQGESEQYEKKDHKEGVITLSAYEMLGIPKSEIGKLHAPRILGMTYGVAAAAGIGTLVGIGLLIYVVK